MAVTMHVGRAKAPGVELHRELEELRQGLLTCLAVLAILVAWVATYARLFVGPQSRWIIGVSLAGAGVLSLLVRSRRPVLGRVLFGMGVLAAVGWLMWLQPHSDSWQVALVALLLCSPLYSARGQITLTAALCAAYALAEFSHRPVSAPGSVSAVAGMLVAISVSSWLSTLQLLRALDWATSSAESAVAMADRLRDRQQELNRTVRALQESQHRLDRANRELTLARNQAEEARQHKFRFAAILSHELRAPLNVIIGFTEMMVLSREAYDEPLPRSYRSDLHEVFRSSQHLLALVDDLLDLARLEARQLPIERDEVDLRQIIEETLGLARAQFRGKPVAFRLEGRSAIPLVFADSRRIRQVFLNLLTNAGRFTDSGSVTVRVQAVSNQELQVTVADTGMGIPAEGVARLFAEFRQVDRSRQAQHGGTGLGLAVSKELIELHGGRMWAESEVGRGSQFHFTLPLVGRQPSLALLPSPPPYGTQTDGGDGLHETFLVLGDDSGVLRRLQRYVEGYRAVAAPDVASARALVRQLHPRAIVVPVWDQNSEPPAPDELHALTDEFSVPAIYVSLTSQRRIWREMGAIEFLQKPVSREALLLCLDAVAPQARTVLVIDDEPPVLTLLSRVIRSLGRDCVVHTACGGREGLEMLAGLTPDLILLDLLMPEVDGLAVLSEIQRDPRLRQVPVAIVTAQTLRDDAAGLGGRLAFYKREALTHGELVEGLQALLRLARPCYVMPYGTPAGHATAPLGEPAYPGTAQRPRPGPERGRAAQSR